MTWQARSIQQFTFSLLFEPASLGRMNSSLRYSDPLPSFLNLEDRQEAFLQMLSMSFCTSVSFLLPNQCVDFSEFEHRVYVHPRHPMSSLLKCRAKSKKFEAMFYVRLPSHCRNISVQTFSTHDDMRGNTWVAYTCA